MNCDKKIKLPGLSNCGDYTLGNAIKISKRDFADTLYYWLSEHLTDQEVKDMAHEFRFEIKGFLKIKIEKKLYEKLYSELFALNMYLIVFVCESIIKDENKRGGILDIFHNIVFERNIKVTGISYSDWMKFMKLIYNEYNKAMEQESLLTPILLVANEFEKNLFGKITSDHYVRFEAGMRIGGIAKQLSKTLQEYDIE